jgi:hypothetical protein
VGRAEQGALLQRIKLDFELTTFHNILQDRALSSKYLDSTSESHIEAAHGRTTAVELLLNIDWLTSLLTSLDYDKPAIVFSFD